MSVSQAIKSLYKRLNITPHAVVIFHECLTFTDIEIVELMESVKPQVKKGALGILSQSDLNENIGFKPWLSVTNHEQRLILESGKQLQLLTLEPNVQFSNHPCVMAGVVGEKSSVLVGDNEIDFPFGPLSLFNRLYENETFIFMDSSIYNSLETKFAFSFLKYVPIKKNVSYDGDEEVSYLDYDVESISILKHPKLSKIVYYEDFGDKRLYGYNYKEMIDTIIKLFISNR